MFTLSPADLTTIMSMFVFSPPLSLLSHIFNLNFTEHPPLHHLLQAVVWDGHSSSTSIPSLLHLSAIHMQLFCLYSILIFTPLYRQPLFHLTPAPFLCFTHTTLLITSDPLCKSCNNVLSFAFCRCKKTEGS